ncbi:MAG: hypothetical protein ACREH5_03665 [Candidatus Omnitrophota bacterium]
MEDNPNCRGGGQFVFRELEPARLIQGIKVTERGKEISCTVTGVEKDGKFVPAYAAKIADSGAGFAYLIYGGAWGIRIRPGSYAAEAWDLSNKHQWGEPFKIYGSEEDLIYVAESR